MSIAFFSRCWLFQEKHGKSQTQRGTNRAVHEPEKSSGRPISDKVVDTGRAPTDPTSASKEDNDTDDDEFTAGCSPFEKAFYKLEDRPPIEPSPSSSLSREDDVHDHSELALSGSVKTVVERQVKALFDAASSRLSPSKEDVPNYDEFISRRLSHGKAEMGCRAEADSASNGSGYDKNTLPFMKNSILWELLESMEVFRKMPQQPHFHPLEQQHEEFREGAAIGLMVTFANLVARIQELETTGSQETFDNKLRTLELLQSNGFDVQLLYSCLEKMQEIRSNISQYEGERLSLREKIIEEEYHRGQLVASIDAHDQIISELKKVLCYYQERRTSVLSERKNKDSEIVQLKMALQANEKAYLSAIEHFNIAKDAPW